MRLLSNAHTHSSFCDGEDSLPEMAKRALELGFTDIGFSGHSPLEGEDWCMTEKGREEYLTELSVLKKQYEGVLGISAGTELDSFSKPNTSGLDYFIGSVHSLRDGGGQSCDIDNTEEKFAEGLERLFGGDIERYIRAYYEKAAENVLTRRPDIAGHFDLPVKYNEGGKYFDEGARWYVETALEAVEAANGAGCIFEVNTHPVWCGYRKLPFLAPFMLCYLAEHGGRVTVNNDAHSAAELGFMFDSIPELLSSCGFRSVWALSGGEFKEMAL